jgi:hypothetical protein
MKTMRMYLLLAGLLFPFCGGLRAQAQLSCGSDDGKKHFCEGDTRRGVQLIKQRSKSACTRGYSWDFDDRGIWVDHGCRGDFLLETGAAPESEANSGQNWSCASDDGEKHYCDADTRRGVRMVQQRSESACTRGYSWDFDDRGIWVDHGCRADFASEMRDHREDQDREHARNESMNDREGGRMVSCSSDDGEKHYCNAETRGGVRLAQQRSESACTRGYSWDFDDRGIWVDHGCRADFQLETREGAEYSKGEMGGRRRSCARAVGEERAHELVRRCLQVATGPRPPCSDDNGCKIITDEIGRGCRLAGNGAPGFCDEYR